MEILTLIMDFIPTGLLNNLFEWFIYILAFWGLCDVYMFWRWKRKGAGKIDQTASFGHWFTVKWMFASQTDLMAEKLPFIKQDLSEVVKVKDDDGNIS